MAKSLRSKWKRKCRAVKRERYGAKELARLKKTLGIDENGDVEMSDITEIATVVDAKNIKENAEAKNDNDGGKETNKTDTEKMEVDSGRVYDKQTLKDQYGNYPVWMNRRKILKHKKFRADLRKRSTNKGKRLTRRQKKLLKEKK